MLDDVLSAFVIWINSAPYRGRFSKHLPFEALRQVQNVLRVNIISFIPLNLTCSISNFTIWHLPISRAKEEHLNVRSNKKRKEAYTWRLLNLNFYMHFVKYKMDHRKEMSLYAPFWLEWITMQTQMSYRAKSLFHSSSSSHYRHKIQVMSGCLPGWDCNLSFCIQASLNALCPYEMHTGICHLETLNVSHSTNPFNISTLSLSVSSSLSFKRWKKT